jgi:hypothetical protein
MIENCKELGTGLAPFLAILRFPPGHFRAGDIDLNGYHASRRNKYSARNHAAPGSTREADPLNTRDTLPRGCLTLTVRGSKHMNAGRQHHIVELLGEHGRGEEGDRPQGFLARVGEVMTHRCRENCRDRPHGWCHLPCGVRQRLKGCTASPRWHRCASQAARQARFRKRWWRIGSLHAHHRWQTRRPNGRTGRRLLRHARAEDFGSIRHRLPMTDAPGSVMRASKR